MCCCRCCMVLPVTSTATGESCYQETMENNARHAGCAAGLRHVCLFTFHLQEMGLLICFPPDQLAVPAGLHLPQALIKLSTVSCSSSQEGFGICSILLPSSHSRQGSAWQEVAGHDAREPLAGCQRWADQNSLPRHRAAPIP